MLRDKKIIISGASGFLGNKLYHKLSKYNKVLGLSHTKGSTRFKNFDLTRHKELQIILDNFKADFFFI